MTRRNRKTAALPERVRGNRGAEAMEMLCAVADRMMAQSDSVGRDPHERLVWIQDFARHDAPNGVQGRENAAGLLNWFVIAQMRGWGAYFSVARGIYKKVQPTDVPMIHEAVRDVLQRFAAADGQHVLARLPVAIGDQLVWQPGRAVSLASSSDSLSQVLAALADLLMSVGPRLRRCETPSCRRLFSLKRQGQKRCRPNCGVDDRVRKWRAENAKRHSKNKKRQYERKIRKQLYPKARVNRHEREQE
jgi:hypothetical protein